jgi:hypothetical protein
MNKRFGVLSALLLALVLVAVVLVLPATAQPEKPGADVASEQAPALKEAEPAADAAACPDCENGILATGGPDQFGYTFKDSNEPDGPVFGWVEISGTNNIAFSDETRHGPYAIGFPFSFYGTDYADFWASSNGWLYIGTTDPGSADLSNDCPLPSTNGIENFVAGIWDDLDNDTNTADPGTGWYQSYAAGSCPYGGYGGACLIVEWDGMYHYASSPADNLTFQIILLTTTTW